MIFWSLYIPGITLLIIPFFHLLPVFSKGNINNYKIDPNNEIAPTESEILYTWISIFVFSLMGFFSGWLIEQDFSKIYSVIPLDRSNWIYFIVSPFILLLIHDVYFYLTHRLLHLPFIFKHVHSWHHRSHKTNPWVAFSFHPLEAIIQIGIVPIVILIIPTHEYILMFFVGFLIFMSVFGHCGYEFRANKMKALNIFNTSIHHDQHHKYVKYNYGIYLNVWDRLFASNYPGYKKAVDDFAENLKENNT